jgi:adenosine deaminase
MPAELNPTTIRTAPKVLLHDHLDGGLRPTTLIELAAATGYRGLPRTDAGELAAWFSESAYSGSLERYLETFTHTVAVMQDRDCTWRTA